MNTPRRSIRDYAKKLFDFLALVVACWLIGELFAWGWNAMAFQPHVQGWAVGSIVLAIRFTLTR